MYFTKEDYDIIYGIIEEAYPELLDDFANFFEPYGDDFYRCTDVNAYTSWLSTNIFEGGTPDEEFMPWTDPVGGLSGQGSDPM